MNYIPTIVKPFPDELLYSWVHRLAVENGLSIPVFCQSYIGLKDAKVGTLRADFRTGFMELCNSFYHSTNPENLYFTLTTIQYEAIAMTQEQQTRYVNNVFRRKDSINTAINYSFTEINMCKECVKQDVTAFGRPYIHRSHQLSGVRTCHRHHCRLLAFSGKPGHECDYESADYTEITTAMPLNCMNAYTDYAQTVFNAGINSDIKRVKSLLYSELKRRGKSSSIDYEQVANTILKWEFSPLIDYSVEEFLRIKMIQATNIKMREIIPFMMFLFPKPEELVEKIKTDSPLIVTSVCLSCGQAFYSTAQALKSGWSCPKCNTKKQAKDKITHLIKIAGSEQYSIVSEFESMNKPVTMLHKVCGIQYLVKPRAFIYEGARCACESTLSEEGVRKNVEAHERFELIKFEKSDKPITIYHKDCGRIFNCQYWKFMLSPTCRCCKPKRMTPKLFEQRVTDLVGDEYEIIKGFVSQSEPIVLRHTACRCVQKYKPSFFLDGQRCRKCGSMVRHENLEKMLDEYSGGRYRITEYGENLCTVVDTESTKEFLLLPSKILQEIIRPTPSPVLPVEKKTQIKKRMSQWEIGFDFLKQYKEEAGTTEIAKRDSYKGYKLGVWMQHQRMEYKNGTLRPDRKALLDEVGLVFDVLDKEWNRKFDMYKRYIAAAGTTYIPRRTEFEGERLGVWVEIQRKTYASEKISQERVNRLLELDEDFFLPQRAPAAMKS